MTPFLTLLRRGGVSFAAKRSNTICLASALLPRTGRSFTNRLMHSDASALPDMDTDGSRSVSAQELAKFIKISNEWWDPMGPFKYLHTMNRPRIQFIREIMSDLFRQPSDNIRWMAGHTAVDVGCGGGLASESLARLGLSVLGIDAAAENVAMARIHMKSDPLFSSGDRLKYMQTTAEQLVASSEDRFDAVVSLEVIEHVNDPVEFCKSLMDLAKPGALVVLSTMNRTALSYLVDIVVPEYLMRSVPQGTHEHSKFIVPDELRLIFRSLGAEPLDTRGLILDPLNNQCHLVPSDLGLLRNIGVQANYISAFRKSS
ncbi:Hexaprenyldihydroxybenzoate methyltransferase, mitochondrial [Coemansia sp. RSA 1813]|nr:Hexaprenyldihydroxybenzoate methyltransferase, mitochondrial [Coemansia sp. RSA 487]KAJ2567069.1 Hexaprenyldihydroxybenzoate methyltransferase, mitochondrial [Coemansia sp. RSA 1813]